MTIVFEGYPKTPRYEKPIIVTEKIDGTNAQIYIRPIDEYYDPDFDSLIFNQAEDDSSPPAYAVRAGSRNRWISPSDDNYGFANWVRSNAGVLVGLGVGKHFGEWWGRGIGRGYDLDTRRFSLFNTSRWLKLHDTMNVGYSIPKWIKTCPDCCDVVPVLDRDAKFSDVPGIMDWLESTGSMASPGYKRPEGVIAFHTGSGQAYKGIIDK